MVLIRLQTVRKVQPTLIGMRPQRSCGWAGTGTCSVACSTGAYLALQCSRSVCYQPTSKQHQEGTRSGIADLGGTTSLRQPVPTQAG